MVKIQKKKYKALIGIIIFIFGLIIIISIAWLIEKEKSSVCDNNLKTFCESQFLIYEGNGKCTTTLVGGYKEIFYWVCINNKYKMQGIYVVTNETR